MSSLASHKRVPILITSIVDGTDFPDGLTVNSIAAKYKSPILLINPVIML
ncbi:cell wall-binding repeat-containing protein [Metaclostridioides mangenotii]|nr:cell wall-binding repeat-containing protein [Clostridioides mangenotii]